MKLTNGRLLVAMGIDTAPEDKIKVSIQIPIAEKTLSPITGGGVARKNLITLFPKKLKVFLIRLPVYKVRPVKEFLSAN